MDMEPMKLKYIMLSLEGHILLKYFTFVIIKVFFLIWKRFSEIIKCTFT